MMDPSTSTPVKTGSPSSSDKRKRSTSLPSETVEYLKAWMMSPEHINHPYPTEQEKAQIMEDTGIELKQLNNWFVNNRIRYWKPRVEALQRQQKTLSASSRALPPPAVTVPQGKKKEETLVESIRRSSSLQSQPQSRSIQADVTLQLSSTAASYLSTRTVSDVSSSNSTSGNSSITSASEGGDDDVSVDGSLTEVDSEMQRKDAMVLMPKSLLALRSPPAKRQRTEEVLLTPRIKYRRKSVELWRDACQNSPGAYCESLPSLDEAAQLFGYTSS